MTIYDLLLSGGAATLCGVSGFMLGKKLTKNKFKRRSNQMPMRRTSDDEPLPLQESRDLLQIAIEHVNHGIAVFNHDFQLSCYNYRFIELYELPENLLEIGANLEKFVYYVAARGNLGEGPAQSLMQERLANLQNSPETLEERRLSSGQIIEVRSELLPDIGLVMTVTDITDRVLSSEALLDANEGLEQRVAERTEELTRLNRALLRAKAEADIANLTKTKFLAAASHDLLQPLNAARLYAAALLEKTSIETDAGRMAGLINQSLDAVEDILAGLLDISRMDSGMLKPEMNDFLLGDMLKQLFGDFDPTARKKGLNLRILPSSIWVKSDRRLLRRILQNFISNALKYTPKGHVLVGVRLKEGMARVDIIDTGDGIPPEKLKVMFQEFERIGAESTQIAGHGLGLSIVERMARLMQHRIEVDSTVGKGTRFSIYLPLGKAQNTDTEGTPQIVQETIFNTLNVLCVDNEPPIIEGMTALLHNWGAQVVSGLSKQDALNNLDSTKIIPDVAVIDYRLDDGDTGFNVIKTLRSKYGADFPCALLTANREVEIREHAEANNIVMLYKPARPAALKAFLKRIASQKSV